jgi:hypothetical protein
MYGVVLGPREEVSTLMRLYMEYRAASAQKPVDKPEDNKAHLIISQID